MAGVQKPPTMAEAPSLSLSPTTLDNGNGSRDEEPSSSPPPAASVISNNISSLRIRDESPSPPPSSPITGEGLTAGQESIPILSTAGSPAHNQPKLKSILPPVTQCTYTACYCEENLWKLCEKIRTEYSTELDYCHVAFISNPRRMVPLWRQKSGKTEDKLAIWDYHVILLYNPDDRCVVYDMDSDLPFPTHFHKYVTETFRTENILQAEYHRFFRVLPAARYLTLFSSDRSHMLKPDGSGAYIHPPPNYDPICTNGVNNLEQFLDMTNPPSKTEYGEIYSLMELVRRYYKPRQLAS